MSNNRTNPETAIRLHDLLDNIRQKTRFDHPVEQFELVETHISLILLTGPFAYKFKKPLNLGFLDFSTLQKRKFCCEEEVRLNRRYSPELYLGVVHFNGNPSSPQLGGEENILEYAVKLLQFPKYSELKYVLDDGRLDSSHIDDLAQQLGLFHSCSEVVPESQYPGSPHCIRQQAMENFAAFKSTDGMVAAINGKLAALEDWSLQSLTALEQVFRSRKHNGRVRECHGDLHLDNIILFRDRLRLFDCIEFSADLRRIDVISEVAFLFMDLDINGHADIGWRFLNAWLQHSGDYPGLSVLQFYLVYRAMVRAKIACIRLTQGGPGTAQREIEMNRVLTYIHHADSYSEKREVKLLITHGLSGSGKTYISQQLLEKIGAIRIRSDVERKRLHALTTTEATGDEVGKGIYTPDKSRQTYQWLQYMTSQVLAAGYPVIVDAAFLQVAEREQMQQLAADYNVPFVILDFQAAYSSLVSRIESRAREGKDPSDADVNVLDWQMKHRDRLSGNEMQYTVSIDTDKALDMDDIHLKVIAQLASLAGSGKQGGIHQRGQSKKIHTLVQ